MARPLAGIRIVEFAGIGPAPFAAMTLADMGAEIIRIDRPGGADPWTRDVIPRGRRSVIVDLKSQSERDEVITLIENADALIEGFRPGVMERLGLGPDEMLKRHPRLVYARMTGWGQDGPLSSTAGHDINYIAITGALHAIGTNERPVPPLNLVGDMGGGAMYLVSGLLAALLRAARTGHGDIIDCSISDCASHLMAMQYDLMLQGRWADARASNLLDGAAPFYRCYECADGAFLAVGCLERPFFEIFARGIGLEPVPDETERMDPANWPFLIKRIGGILQSKTRDQWVERLQNSDACIAPVLRMTEAPGHPHQRARNVFHNGAPAPQPRFSSSDHFVAEPDHDSHTLAACVTNWANRTG